MVYTSLFCRLLFPTLFPLAVSLLSPIRYYCIYGGGDVLGCSWSYMLDRAGGEVVPVTYLSRPRRQQEYRHFALFPYPPVSRPLMRCCRLLHAFCTKPNTVDPARLRDSGVRRHQGPLQSARGPPSGAGVGEGVPPWDKAGRVHPHLGCWQGRGKTWCGVPGMWYGT